MKSVFMLTAALCVVALSPLAANAASVTFNFNAGNAGGYLQPNQVLVPNVGTGQTAQVSILNAINPNQTFNIVDSYGSQFSNTPNSGNNIQEVEGSNEVLQLTFAHAIHSIRLLFSVIPGVTNPPVNPNPLQLTAYQTAVSATPLATQFGVGDTYGSSHQFQYFGTLNLASAIAFNTITLGLSNPNTANSDTFAFDDIVADDDPVVPEPGAIALGIALGMPALWRLRKRRVSRSS